MYSLLQGQSSRPSQSRKRGLLLALIIMAALALSAAAWRTSAVSAGAADAMKGASQGVGAGVSRLVGLQEEAISSISAATCSTPQFSEASSPDAGGQFPNSVAVGDFNNDGKQDFVTANNVCCGQGVGLGDGTGTSFNVNSFSLADAGSPRSVAVGDFNRDGNQDFAAANENTDNVTIRLGNGTGDFPNANAFNVGAGDAPFYVAIGDFNQDGKQDLAVANKDSDNVTIRLGDGMGGFPDANASTVSAGGGPRAVVIGDFNRDGKQDLAVGNFDFDSGVSNVTILLGNGMGAFTEAAGSPVDSGGSLTHLAVADFNNDDKQDLVIVSFSNVAAIRLGDGMGGFTNGPTANVGSTPLSVAVGDFNQDGNQDFAVANYTSDDLTVRLGDGTGAFPDANAATIVAGDAPTSIAVGDFNRDGKADLAVSNANSNDVVILLNTCNATPCGGASFTQPAGSPFATGNSPDSVAIGDFNRDGIEDMAVANQTSHNVTIRLGDGTGGFPDSSTVGAGGGPVSIAVGDFNNDGNQDFAVANFQNDNVTIRLGDGAGGFPDANASTVAVAHFPRSVAIGDFNNDGKQDLAVVSNAYASVGIMLGDGMGGFSNFSVVHTSGAPVFVAVGDFNNDGKQDLAVANSAAHTVTIHKGNGMGGFDSNFTSTIAQYTPSFVAVGDFNRDGNQDFAVANSSGANVTIRLGNGMGGFPDGSTFNAASPQSIAIGDFNLDGNPDLAVTNEGADNVAIRLGDGAGGFPDANATTVGTGDGPIAIVAGDFNRDGKTDLAATNHNSANVTVLLNDCAPSADLSITKTDLADPLMIGQKINYHIVVTNHGPSDATGAIVTNHLPSSSTFVSAISSTGSCSSANGIVTCQLGNLSNGATATVDIVVKSSGSPDTVTSTTSIAANEADPNPSNNQGSESTRLVGFQRLSFPSPTVIGGCQNSIGNLQFTSPAPAGVTIRFKDTLAGVAPIAPVVTQGGELSIQVTAATNVVAAEQLGTVTASTTAGQSSVQAQVRLLPVNITLLKFGQNPAQGGQHTSGTVAMTCSMNRDVVVRLTPNKTEARPDVGTVTIRAGQSSANFGITTRPVSSARNVTFTASHNGKIKRAILRLVP